MAPKQENSELQWQVLCNKKKTEYTWLLKFIFLDSSTLFSLTGHALNNKLL